MGGYTNRCIDSWVDRQTDIQTIRQKQTERETDGWTDSQIQSLQGTLTEEEGLVQLTSS
jgi:hypothetical protein